MSQSDPTEVPDESPSKDVPASEQDDAQATELGGRDGPDPTRYGDWEKNGRCIDF